MAAEEDHTESNFIHSYQEASPDGGIDDTEPAQDDVTQRLQRKMARRPSQTDIYKQGIVPENYFEDPIAASRASKLNKEMAQFALADALPARPSQVDLERKGVVPMDYFKDPQKSQERQKMQKEQAQSELSEFLPQRKDKQALVEQKHHTARIRVV